MTTLRTIVLDLAVLIAATAITYQRPPPPDNVTNIASPRPLRNPRGHRR